MLALLIAVVAQTNGGNDPPPLPLRAYSPHLIDPGLDGGRYRWFQNGELTPDGKLLIAFRNPADPDDPSFQDGLFRSALVATVVHPERMLEDTSGHGHLAGFFESLGTAWPFGEDFTFGEPIEPIGPGEPAESRIIYYGYPLAPIGSQCNPGGPCDPCEFGDPEPEPYCFRQVCRPDSTPPEFLEGFKLDFPDYPLPIVNGDAHMTFALTPQELGNPYPSDPNGVYDEEGTHTTYRIWLLRTHSRGYEGVNAAGDPNLVCRADPGELVEPNPADPPEPDPEFVCQNITVVLDADSNIVHTDVEKPFQWLLTYPGQKIKGIEPSITEDGRLIVFHGNGSDANFVTGNANITYIFNPTPCSPTGWTPPRSITELPLASELAGSSVLAFKLRYPVFLKPIRMPPAGSGQPEFEFTSAHTVRGTYPWLSKDGSFFIASSTVATESKEIIGGTCSNTVRVRAGGYACGLLTGGYIKHIDDVGINPTRNGGPFRWPWYATPSCADDLQNSWRALTFSTGIKPGPWEPFLGQDALIPTQVASERIPVLPVFESEIDTYGEVRFEEADGNYLLYLACNESFVVDQVLAGEANVTFDLNSTPDTSGRAPRARCTLNSGAAFPQEVMVLGSKGLRDSIGAALNNGGPLHENVGFKGQGIVFNQEGRIDVLDAPGLAGRAEFSVQGFVKALDEPGQTWTLFEYGRAGTPLVTLKLDAQGKFLVSVQIEKSGGVIQTVTFTSRTGAIDFDGDMFNPGTGWRHVALTFDGDDNDEGEDGSTRLRLYLDGLLDKQRVVLSTSTLNDPAGTDYCIVGPGRTAPNDVDEEDKVLILDEVAVSDTVRTSEEMRRDAYVVPLPPAFGPWPAGAPTLPTGLVGEEAKWPQDSAGSPVSFDQTFADLGQVLFNSTDLSHPALEPNRRSCATCHAPATHFVMPGQTKALDVNGVQLPFNAPTLRNAAFGVPKFFDGRAASLEDQILEPILAGPDMGVPGIPPGSQAIQDVLGRMTDEFAPFGVAVTEANLVKALAMYLRVQTAGGSPFDTHVGLPDVPKFLRGQAVFFGKGGCFHCHRGSNFSDDDFHNVFTVKTTESIEGRSDATGRAIDVGRLKTPTLRNISLTGPYFHDGSASSLTAVVNHYDQPFVAGRLGEPDRHLRPLFLTASERSDLVFFLEMLASP